MSRWRVMIWIDDQKPDELKIGQDILALKKKRQFHRTVLNGIRLILDLAAGKTDVLKELFPLVVDQIEYEMIKREDDEDDNTPSAESILAEMRAEFAATRNAIAEQGKKIIPLFDNDGGLAMAGQKPSAQASTNTLGKDVQFTPVAPDDDNGDTIVLNRGSSIQNGKNLIAGILGLD